MADKILIVSTDPNVRDEIARLLDEAPGHEIITSASGEDALQKIANIGPRLVLLDIFLPERSSYELCRMIKEDIPWEYPDHLAFN